MVKIGRQKNRPNTLVSPATVGWRTLAEKVYYIKYLLYYNNIRELLCMLYSENQHEIVHLIGGITSGYLYLMNNVTRCLYFI